MSLQSQFSFFWWSLRSSESGPAANPLPQYLWSHYTVTQLAALNPPLCDQPSADRWHRVTETAVLLSPHSGFSFIPGRRNWLRATRHSCYEGGMSRAAESVAALQLDLTLATMSASVIYSSQTRQAHEAHLIWDAIYNCLSLNKQFCK